MTSLANYGRLQILSQEDLDDINRATAEFVANGMQLFGTTQAIKDQPHQVKQGERLGRAYDSIVLDMLTDAGKGKNGSPLPPHSPSEKHGTPGSSGTSPDPYTVR